MDEEDQFPHRNLARAAFKALGKTSRSDMLTVEVIQKAAPPFTFQRYLKDVTGVLEERKIMVSATQDFGASWHTIGRTPKEADAEKQIKSNRKVVYDEIDRLVLAGSDAEEAAIALQSRFTTEAAWVPEIYGTPNEKKRTLTNFISALKDEKKKRQAISV